LASAAALAATGWTSRAEARDQAASIEIGATDLADALSELSSQTGVSIGTEGHLPETRTPAVHGARSVRAALDRILAGSNLRARQVGPHAWRIERSAHGAGGDVNSSAPAEAVPLTMSEIVVTGTKRRQPLADLPMAALVVPISERDGGNTARGSSYIGSQIDGLSLTSLGAGRNRLFLRGVADSAFNGESQTTVAVVLDEARITLSAPDPDIRLVDMERVEVLKGPQGASHGVGALGGVYHLATRRADLDETSLSLAAGLIAKAHGDAGHVESAVANLPIAGPDGGAAIRLVGYRSDEPGWIDTGNRRDSDRTRVNGARVGLGVDAGGGWRFDGTGFLQTIDAADTNYVYRHGARHRPSQLPEPHDNDLRHITARLAQEGGDLDIVLTSAMTWHKLTSRFDATRGAEHFALADPRYLDERRAFRLWDSEARISSSNGPVQWLLGLSRIEARQRDATTLQGLGQTLALDGENRRIVELALFGSIAVPVTSTLRIDAGARLFRNTFHETEDDETRHRHRHGLTPSLAIAWQPHGRQLVFARYGSAIRVGDFDVANGATGRGLKDDEIQTIELGWRMNWTGGKLELGAWHSWWHDMQSDMPEQPGLFETQNVGDARILGVEASAEHAIASGFTLRGGINWTRARLVHNMLGVDLESRRLPAVPSLTLRAALEKSFEFGSVPGLVRLKLRYVAPAHLSFDPRYDAETGRLWETGFDVQARLGSFDVSLGVQNLLDRRANTFAYGNQLRFLASRLYTPQPPRQMLLTVQRSF
jgi:outer membrane receptor protein involved in Fe transport